MSRLNSVCAVILLITYIQFCSTKKVIEDFDARTTENYNTQTSEEWFDPMKQKLIPTVEDALRLLSPDGRGHNEKEDKIGVEDSSDTSTIQIQDQTKASSLDSKYETTDVNGNESTTLTTISAQYTNVGGDVSVAAELFSNKQWKMFEPIRDAIAVPAQPLSENTIYQGTGSDQILSVNSSSVSNSTSTDELSANQNLTTTTPKPSNTPTHARTKFRQIQTSKPKIFKYNAEDVLQRFLDDAYIRKPMAALIDTSPNVLRKTKLLWKSALRPNSPLDIVLVAFNSSGVGATYSFTNTRTMIAGLDSVQESKSIDGGSAFFGIMRTSELVPYDSAIFISTDSVPADTESAQYAAITLLKKRIRLYLIWFGPQISENNIAFGQNIEGGILGEVAIRSGGEIIRVTEESVGPEGRLGLVTLFLRNNLHGSKEIELPIDSSVSDVKIKLNGNMETATLATPSGG